jgi:hypothetical protein
MQGAGMLISNGEKEENEFQSQHGELCALPQNVVGISEV